MVHAVFGLLLRWRRLCLEKTRPCGRMVLVASNRLNGGAEVASMQCVYQLQQVLLQYAQRPCVGRVSEMARPPSSGLACGMTRVLSSQPLLHLS